MGRQGAEGDRPIDPAVLVENRLTEAVETITAAPLPVHRLGDPPLLAFDHLLQAWSPISIPMYRRPILWATAAVVPEPRKESRTRSPGLVEISRMR